MQTDFYDIADFSASESATAQAISLLKLLSHPVRLSILCNLMGAEEMSAGEIVKAEEHRASQSQVSQYLAMLRQDSIVSTRRDGQTIYYRVKDEKVQAVIQKLQELFCDGNGRDPVGSFESQAYPLEE